MRKQHFLTLKKMLQAETNFSNIFDFFFEKFGEDQDFYKLGELTINEKIHIVLKATGRNFYGENCKISNPRLTEIEEENFIHGTCFLDEHLVLVLYFTDINMGLASISMGASMFNFVHLKASQIPDGYGIQFNQNSNMAVN